MNKLINYSFILILGVLAFNLLLKNKAEADPMQSYEKSQSGNAVFIDVREESEVKEGMIKGALWVALSKIEENKKSQIEKIKELTNGKIIYLYCKSGTRAGKAKSYLESVGIKSINMGGYKNLLNKKLPSQPRPQ